MIHPHRTTFFFLSVAGLAGAELKLAKHKRDRVISLAALHVSSLILCLA